MKNAFSLTGAARASVLGAAGVVGCAASLPEPMSAPVRELGGVSCPEERIQVVDTRVVDGDKVFVLDAAWRSPVGCTSGERDHEEGDTA